MTVITYPLLIHPVLHWAAGPASRALLNLKPKLRENQVTTTVKTLYKRLVIFLAVRQIREFSNHFWVLLWPKWPAKVIL